MKLLRRLLGEWDEDDRFSAVAFDAITRELPGGFRRVGDADRGELDRWLEREASESLGETNLEQALETARRLLAEPGQGEPHILYIGDGLATGGETRLTELRDELAGEATFVAVAVGDRVDQPLLGELAARSGGMVVRLGVGDDIPWQAFDLVAAPMAQQPSWPLPAPRWATLLDGWRLRWR